MDWETYKKLADVATPMGFGPMYHVTPRKNRERILQEGLQGQAGQASPWSLQWDQPKGNYLFDDPEDAKDYIYSIHKGLGEEPDFEDRYEQPEPPEDFWDWPDEEQDNWHEENEPVERTDDPNGYDIWKVNAHGLPLGPDPESELARQWRRTQPWTTPHHYQPWDLDRLHEYSGDPAQLQADEGEEPRRYYSPIGIQPARLQLHEHVPSWNLSEEDSENRTDESYDRQVPSPWMMTPMTEWPMPGHDQPATFSAWRLAETHPKPYEAKMWTGKPNSRGILGPVKTPFWTTSHHPEALGFAGGEGMEGYVHPVQVRFKNPAHYFAGATWTPSSIEEARSAGCDGCVVHWPEDLRDPSDPMPSRTWAIALDPGAVVPGHLADSVQES